MAQLQAQYFGMISEVDAQLARVWAVLSSASEWTNTVIVVTADHGEQLGDQGLIQKAGFYESSYAVLGIVRDPRFDHVGVVDDFTENVDIMPTLCEAMGIDVPAQCDGFPLTPFLRGERPDVRGATRPTTSGTGVTCSSPAATTSGHGIAGSNGRTSPYGAVATGHSCTSATVRGDASTSPPTRRGRPR